MAVLFLTSTKGEHTKLIKNILYVVRDLSRTFFTRKNISNIDYRKISIRTCKHKFALRFSFPIHVSTASCSILQESFLSL